MFTSAERVPAGIGVHAQNMKRTGVTTRGGSDLLIARESPFVTLWLKGNHVGKFQNTAPKLPIDFIDKPGQERGEKAVIRHPFREQRNGKVGHINPPAARPCSGNE